MAAAGCSTVGQGQSRSQFQCQVPIPNIKSQRTPSILTALRCGMDSRLEDAAGSGVPAHAQVSSREHLKPMLLQLRKLSTNHNMRQHRGSPELKGPVHGDAHDVRCVVTKLERRGELACLEPLACTVPSAERQWLRLLCSWEVAWRTPAWEVRSSRDWP